MKKTEFVTSTLTVKEKYFRQKKKLSQRKHLSFKRMKREENGKCVANSMNSEYIKQL